MGWKSIAGDHSLTTVQFRVTSPCSHWPPCSWTMHTTNTQTDILKLSTNAYTNTYNNGNGILLDKSRLSISKCWVSLLVLNNWQRKNVQQVEKRPWIHKKKSDHPPKPKQDLLLCSAARNSMDTMHVKWTVTFQAYSAWAVITFSLSLSV